MLTDIRESYQAELSKAKGSMERNIDDIRAADANDARRIREECNVR